MSQNLQKYLPLFDHISQIKVRCDRRIVFAIFAKDPNFIKALQEIALNVVEGNISLNESQKKKLAHHKNVLIDLARKKGKRTVVQSGGGFLPLLLPLVSEVLASLING
jgi:hypothetical protein